MFLHIFSQMARFSKEMLLHITTVFWFSLQLLSETFLTLKRIQRDIITNIHRSSCEVPVILVRFYWNLHLLELPRRIFQKYLYQISWKSVEWKRSCCVRTCGQANGQTRRNKQLTVAFRNFTKAPNNPVLPATSTDLRQYKLNTL